MIVKIQVIADDGKVISEDYFHPTVSFEKEVAYGFEIPVGEFQNLAGFKWQPVIRAVSPIKEPRRNP
jgi:hypothetical protein